MSKKFGWKEWDNHLLHFIGKPVKILEIGVFKGEAMEKFAQVFLESNKDAEYYGIDTWEGSPEYVEINFKEIEKSALARKNASPRKNNINFIKKESVIALPELIIKNIKFDIIFIDASHTAKDVLYDSILAFKLLNVNGLAIFDDYLWQKLEPNIFTPKPAIDAMLNIFKDEIDVLYMGYQVIIKKVNFKFLPRQTDRTIIDGFISLLNKYWNDNEMKENSIIFQLKKLPNIEPNFDDLKSIKIRELENINIVKRFNKYSLNCKQINDELKNKSVNINNNIIKILSSSECDIEMLMTLQFIYKLNNKITESITVINSTTSNNKTLFSNLSIITIKDIKDILNRSKKDNIKTDNLLGINTNSYNDILLQILLLKYVLNKQGNFIIDIEMRFDFINDLLILLNHIFSKIKIYISSDKIGILTVKIVGLNFIELDEDIFDNIYKIVNDSNNSNKEIVSIFNKKNLYINCDILQNSIFDQTKKIINIVINNQKLIMNNINKININNISKTLNDLANINL
jgi:predicted O-methyltransferase YrrM